MATLLRPCAPKMLPGFLGHGSFIPWYSDTKLTIIRMLLASLQDAVNLKRGVGSGGFRPLRELHHRLISIEPVAR